MRQCHPIRSSIKVLFSPAVAHLLSCLAHGYWEGTVLGYSFPYALYLAHAKHSINVSFHIPKGTCSLNGQTRPTPTKQVQYRVRRTSVAQNGQANLLGGTGIELGFEGCVKSLQRKAPGYLTCSQAISFTSLCFGSIPVKWQSYRSL